LKPRGTLVIDASVALKWYIPEMDSDRALSVLKSRARLIAPDLIMPEIGSALWKKIRRGELAAAEARRILEALVSSRHMIFRASGPLIQGALNLALRLPSTVYDALYLTLAVSENCPLITADGKLVRAVQHSRLRGSVLVLADVPGEVRR